MEGNQMKMRETMLVVRDALDTISAHEDDIEFVRAWIAQTKEAVQEALSAPPRQCDAGTPEEQSDRFANFCDSHSACSQCPVKSRWIFANGHKPSCGVLWAQMPYEAEEGGAE